MQHVGCEAETERLDLAFAALADPIRRSIVARLVQGEATVAELAAPFPVSQQAVSRHLKVLERAGLVSRSRAAQSRPVRLEPDQLAGMVSWIERRRLEWTQRHDRLAEHLRTLPVPEHPEERS